MSEIIKIEINEWYGWIKNEKRLSQNTILSYEKDLKSLLHFLTNYYGREINLEELQKINEEDLTGWFFQRIKSGISQRSNARALSSVKSFFSFLLKKRKIKINNISNINGPKFRNSLPRPLTKVQVDEVFKYIKLEKTKWILIRNLSIVILMWGYGLRISEVLGLKKKDLETSSIRIKGKGGKIRIIPILEQISCFIKSLDRECPFIIKDNDILFKGVRGKNLQPTIIQKLIRDLRKNLILPENFTPHSLRHTFATELLENFVDLRTIQELLGHSSLSTTQRYVSVSTSRIQSMLEKNHPLSDD